MRIDQRTAVAQLRTIVAKADDEIGLDDLRRLAELDAEAPDLLPHVRYGIDTVAENAWLPRSDHDGRDAVDTYRRWLGHYDTVGDAETARLLTVEHGGFRLGTAERDRLVDMLAPTPEARAQLLDVMPRFQRSSAPDRTRLLLDAVRTEPIDLASEAAILRSNPTSTSVHLTLKAARAAQTRTPEEELIKQQLVRSLEDALKVTFDIEYAAVGQALASTSLLEQLFAARPQLTRQVDAALETLAW